MKILDVNAFSEKLKINPVSLNDFNNTNLFDKEKVEKFYTDDFISPENGYIHFDDFYGSLVSNHPKDHGLVFKGHDKFNYILQAEYDHNYSCFLFYLDIWGIGMNTVKFQSLGMKQRLDLTNFFGVDFSNRYSISYIDQHVNNDYDRFAVGTNYVFLKIKPLVFSESLIHDVFLKTYDFNNKHFSTGLSYDNGDLYSLVVKLFPKQKTSLLQDCIDDAEECLNYQYNQLLDMINEKFDDIVK